MKASDDHWEAKFKVLSENILHHVKEEESEMFIKARKLDVDYDALGVSMLTRKEALKTAGMPTLAEQTLIAKNGIADSPAEVSRVHA